MLELINYLVHEYSTHDKYNYLPKRLLDPETEETIWERDDNKTYFCMDLAKLRPYDQDTFPDLEGILAKIDPKKRYSPHLPCWY